MSWLRQEWHYDAGRRLGMPILGVSVYKHFNTRHVCGGFPGRISYLSTPLFFVRFLFSLFFNVQSMSSGGRHLRKRRLEVYADQSNPTCITQAYKDADAYLYVGK